MATPSAPTEDDMMMAAMTMQSATSKANEAAAAAAIPYVPPPAYEEAMEEEQTPMLVRPDEPLVSVSSSRHASAWSCVFAPAHGARRRWTRFKTSRRERRILRTYDRHGGSVQPLLQRGGYTLHQVAIVLHARRGVPHTVEALCAAGLGRSNMSAARWQYLCDTYGMTPTDVQRLGLNNAKALHALQLTPHQLALAGVNVHGRSVEP